MICKALINDIEDIESTKQDILTFCEDCKKPPVLFLSAHDSSGSFIQLLDLTKDLRSKFLTVNFDYFDESKKEEEFIDMNQEDILKPERVLKLAMNPMKEEEVDFAIDLYRLLKDDKDAEQLLDSFFQERYDDADQTPSIPKDIDDFEDFFNDLKF